MIKEVVSKIRNLKHEIRNKFKMRMLKSQTGRSLPCFEFQFLYFRFVSDFVLRISDFQRPGGLHSARR